LSGRRLQSLRGAVCGSSHLLVVGNTGGPAARYDVRIFNDIPVNFESGTPVQTADAMGSAGFGRLGYNPCTGGQPSLPIQPTSWSQIKNLLGR